MTFFKYAAAIVFLFAGLPALLPSEMITERQILIQKSQEEVYSYVVNLEAWPEWSPWLAEDPKAQYEFHGIPGVVGSYQQWDGVKVGAGKQTLTELREPEYMAMQLEFLRPEAAPAQAFMRIENQNNQALVTWGMKSELSYPMGRLFGWMAGWFVGRKFDEGLRNLKTRLEQGS
jgi:hypothetical protein